MTKERYKLLEELHKELEASAMEALHWYSDNVERIHQVEKLEFMDDYSDEECGLWFEGEEDNYCGDGIQKILPWKMLFYMTNRSVLFSICPGK